MNFGDEVQLVIAAATGAAAWAAWRSARESQRATQATLFTQLMSRYNSPEMSEALREFTRLRERAQPSFTAFAESWARDLASTRPLRDVTECDRQRRLVAHFFWLASRLIEDGLITKGLQEELLELSGARVMRDVVLELELALHKAEQSPSAAAMHRIERFKRVFFPGGRRG